MKTSFASLAPRPIRPLTVSVTPLVLLCVNGYIRAMSSFENTFAPFTSKSPILYCGPSFTVMRMSAFAEILVDDQRVAARPACRCSRATRRASECSWTRSSAYLSVSNSPFRHQKNASGLGVQRGDDVVVRQRLVPDDLDAGDRQPPPFVDAEDQRRRVAILERVDVDLGEVVAFALIERVDPRDVLRDLRRIDRLADDQVDALAHRARRHFVGARHAEVAQNAALDDSEHEQRLAAVVSHSLPTDSKRFVAYRFLIACVTIRELTVDFGAMPMSARI